MSTKLGLYLAVFICSMLWASCSPRLMKNTALEKKISCSLRVENDTTYAVLVGHDTLRTWIYVPCFFEVRNDSDKSIYFNNNPNGELLIRAPLPIRYKLTRLRYLLSSRDKIKRSLGFDIRVEDEKGDLLKPNEVLGLGRGRVGIVEIAPKQTGEIRVDLQGYRFTSGAYKLNVSRNLIVYLNKKRGRNRKGNAPYNYKKVMNCGTKKASTTITINEPFKDIPKN